MEAFICDSRKSRSVWDDGRCELFKPSSVRWLSLALFAVAVHISRLICRIIVSGCSAHSINSLRFAGIRVVISSRKHHPVSPFTALRSPAFLEVAGFCHRSFGHP
jgi:hypothetical protein